MGEHVYLGRDNENSIVLKSDDLAVNLSSIIKMTLSFGSTLISSTNLDSDPILWAKEGYDTGEVRFVLGGESITPGFYVVPLIVYSADYELGLLWTNIEIMVIADSEAVEATP